LSDLQQRKRGMHIAVDRPGPSPTCKRSNLCTSNVRCSVAIDTLALFPAFLGIGIVGGLVFSQATDNGRK
jgi:hypothetical protein